MVYLSVPLGYRMWQKGIQAKACGIERSGPIVDEYPNLDVSCNARYDSVMYDLTPEPTGKRGRPAKHGKRLSTEVDFTLSNEKIGNYFLGHAELFQML